MVSDRPRSTHLIKTRSSPSHLSRRIRRLIDRLPSRTLALAFTNPARDRILKSLQSASLRLRLELLKLSVGEAFQFGNRQSSKTGDRF
jgi:hypothetical protein